MRRTIPLCATLLVGACTRRDDPASLQQAATTAPFDESVAFDSFPTIDQSIEPDFSFAGDFSFARDLSFARDFSFAPDFSFVPDMSMAPDLSFAPDMSFAPDLSFAPDMSFAPDLSPAPDLVAAPDLPPATTSWLMWGDRQGCPLPCTVGAPSTSYASYYSVVPADDGSSAGNGITLVGDEAAFCSFVSSGSDDDLTTHVYLTEDADQNITCMFFLTPVCDPPDSGPRTFALVLGRDSAPECAR